MLECIKEDKELRKNIYTFKVSRHNDEIKQENDQYVPVIVIYPNYGKSAAQVVLDRISHYFLPYAETWGTGNCPRYNKAGKNKLIYYAQGDGATKTRLERDKKEMFNQIYEEDGIHFHPSLGYLPMELKLPNKY